MARGMKTITEGMRDIILNNWYEHRLSESKYQSGQLKWMEEEMEGHFYGPINVYNWKTNKLEWEFYFQNKDDKVLFELTWGHNDT